MWTWIIVGIAVVVVILLCLALAVANFSFENFQEKHQKLSKVANSAHLHTLEYVQQINKERFSGKLVVVPAKEYGDFYSSGKVGLSAQTRKSNSLASLAVVSHELGHARQDVSGDLLKQLSRLRVRGRAFGVFFSPLLVVALVFCILWVFGVLDFWALIAGCGCAVLSILIFLFSIVIKAKEIKIEHQASDYALEFLKEYLTTEEVKLCKELLDSARLTYWAGLLRTLLWWTGMSKKGQMFR